MKLIVLLLVLVTLSHCLVFPRCENITFSQVLKTPSNNILDATLDVDNGNKNVINID